MYPNSLLNPPPVNGRIYGAKNGKWVEVKSEGPGPTPDPGAKTFLELTDTPSTYNNNAGKFVKVKADGTGLEFTTSQLIVPPLDDVLEVGNNDGGSGINMTGNLNINGSALLLNNAPIYSSVGGNAQWVIRANSSESINYDTTGIYYNSDGGVELRLKEPNDENTKILLDTKSISKFEEGIGNFNFTGWSMIHSGWRIMNQNGNSDAIFDNLTIRKALRVFELEINKIRASNGEIWVTDTAKVNKFIAKPKGN